MEEKRKNRRIALKSKLIVKRLDNRSTNNEELEIEILDVSINGIGFKCTTALTIGAIYEAYLTLWTKETIHAFLEIVRIEKGENEELNYGSIFIGMPDSELQRIGVYDVVSEPERYTKKD